MVRPKSAREEFVRDTRESVARWVDPRHHFPGWTDHQHDQKGLFATDARLTTGGGDDIYLWVAGDSERAERAASSASQYRRWDLTGSPLIGLRAEGVKPRTAGRVAAIVGEEGVVMLRSDRPGHLRDHLARLDVPLAA